MAKGSNDNSAAVKKVAKAAETAGQRDLSVRSRLGFPAIVGLICVLGIALVTFARLTREAEALPVQNRDHWHAVYGIYDCTGGGGAGAYLPPFQSTNDPLGIHSHQDGIMHIHPFFDAADGPDAQVKVWAEAMFIEITDDEIVLDNGATMVDGTDCGEAGIGELHLRKWQFDFVTDSADPEIITTGLADVNFLNDREVYIFTNAPLDAEIPLPPTDRFDALNSVAGAITSAGPVVIDPDAEVDFDVEGPDADDAPADAGDDPADADDAPADAGDDPADADDAPADAGDDPADDEAESDS